MEGAGSDGFEDENGDGNIDEAFEEVGGDMYFDEVEIGGDGTANKKEGAGADERFEKGGGGKEYDGVRSVMMVSKTTKEVGVLKRTSSKEMGYGPRRSRGTECDLLRTRGNIIHIMGG